MYDLVEGADLRMSKHRRHDDDIYVEAYTRRTGKYRYVPGHYRTSPRRRKAEREARERANGRAMAVVAVIFCLALLSSFCSACQALFT